jgi:hypothetical protein
MVLGRFQWKVPNVWWSLKGEGETSFSPFLTFPPTILFEPFFSINLKVLLHHGSKLLPYDFILFSFTYKLQPRILMYQVFHTLIVKLILIEDFFSPFLDFMLLRMTIFYGRQAAQVNEELPLESSLDLALMQHLHNENFELQKVRIHLKVEPF